MELFTLSKIELLTLSKIRKHFPSQTADEHIHIIIQRPVETKEIHDTATYRRNAKKYHLWPDNLISFEVLALHMFHIFDRTEDGYIIINCEYGSEKEAEAVCLIDDEDLASVIWTQEFKMLFGLTTDSYSDLPRFDGELADTLLTQPIMKRYSMKYKMLLVQTKQQDVNLLLPFFTALPLVMMCPEYEVIWKGPMN
ncbi:hypothetical protein RclHR1_14740001 [Rhizophagus clarus]|nr:hypothetical protein RclHR1_14740001 [Rhizophagus clarus]